MQESIGWRRHEIPDRGTRRTVCIRPLVPWFAKCVSVGLALLLASGARAGIILTTLPDQLSHEHPHGVATTVGTEAVFAGGIGEGMGLPGTAAVDIYNASTGVWSTAVLSQRRFDHAATTVGSKAMFAGGEASLLYGPTLDRVDIYEGGAWSTASLSEARHTLAAASVGGRALFAGGVGDSGKSAVVDIYDSASDSWSAASLSEARYYLAATSVGDLALFGGGLDSSNHASAAVDIYDAATSSWSTARLSVARSYLAATSAGGVALFGGGERNDGSSSDVVDIYDPATDTWRTASLSVAREGLTATSVGDLAFFGGGGSRVVDIYHVPSDTWYTAQLSVARMSHMATSVGNQAIFAGGWGDDSVDIFEVTDTTSWTRAAAGGVGDWGDFTNWDSVVGPLACDPVFISNGGSAQLTGAARGASLTIGGGAGGTLELAPGSSLPIPAINVGALGVLNVQQDWTYDGALTIGGGDVNLGANTLFLDGGGALGITGSTLTAGRLVVGETGPATATQSGGTVTINGALQVGHLGGSDGTYELSGDATVQLNVSGNSVIGVTGTGRFVQAGGQHSVGSELRVGMNAGSSGTYELSGGDLSVASFGVIGWHGEGTFQQSGGTHTAGGRLYIGYQAAGVGRYELGGTGVLSATSGEQIGYQGAGTFAQTGGTHQVTGNLVLGVGATGNGTYTMESGALDVSGTLRVGSNGTGRLELEGGNVTAGDLDIGAAGTVVFTGGTLSVGSIASAGSLGWFGGTLNVTGAGGLALGPAELLGSALTLTGTQALNVTNQMAVPLGSILTVGSGAGFSAGTLSNAGTTMLLDPGTTFGAGGASNSGTLSVFAGAVDFGGGLTNTGQAVFMGTTVAGSVYTPTGSTVTVLDTVTFNDAVRGAGTFWGPGTTVFNGEYDPGDSPAIVTFQGGVVLGATNQLIMELAGLAAGTGYDQVNVLVGDLILGGELELVVDRAFRELIQSDDTFILMAAGSVSGDFANVAPGGRLQSTDLLSEFTVYYGPTSPFDPNWVVLADFAAIPEPATFALLALGGLGLLRRRRRLRG